jgi:ribosome maturation factor RimP
MDLVAEIRRIAEENLTPGQFLIDVRVSAKQGPKKVQIIVDGDKGITIDECAALSRSVAKAMDENTMIGDNYLLEVTSPGVEQPLTLRRQYVRHVGRSLKVKVGGEQFEGKLISVNENAIVLEIQTGSGKKTETTNKEIQLTTIEKAFVQVSFK